MAMLQTATIAAPAIHIHRGVCWTSSLMPTLPRIARDTRKWKCQLRNVGLDTEMHGSYSDSNHYSHGFCSWVPRHLRVARLPFHLSPLLRAVNPPSAPQSNGVWQSTGYKVLNAHMLLIDVRQS